MNRQIFTIATRPNGSKGQFNEIQGLPLLKALELNKNKSDAEFVILNTQAR